ncbi:hypothetical protein FEZ08_08135 [Culicoidibacter larvae]|uniref:LPXTG cell wall anchor domain-containing protein n=1 Tax=Culicoidibacter larvae TaxID=2579976 RepID=A0A5R8QCG8_9FIRM|nr:hypothetical protein FEZ08_08135 [Culicoidibacter larvae]
MTITGIFLIISGSSLTFFLIKRRKKE